ncbi:MAG: molybdopterin-dependent oxidoreductase [Sphingomonadaceae bacterium]|nr:molybdopterin-dependent oxidoreductase [Sphingomonadaceae bacterium]
MTGNLTAVALALGIAANPAALPAVPSATVLVVDGAVARPLRLDAARLAALPRAQLTATIHGQFLSCSGAWLADILGAAGVPSGEGLRGAAMAMVIIARAADGYRVAFSLGEVDRTLGRARILVADRCNDAPLADDGPLRLIVAGDLRGARSVKALDRLTVVAVP